MSTLLTGWWPGSALFQADPLRTISSDALNSDLVPALASVFSLCPQANPRMRRCRRVPAIPQQDTHCSRAKSCKARRLLMAAKVLGLACVAALGTLPTAGGFSVGGSLWSSRVQRGSCGGVAGCSSIAPQGVFQDRPSYAPWSDREERELGRRAGLVSMAAARTGKDAPRNPPNKVSEPF